jgi:tRNA pseudouridine55 synthase
MTTPPPLFLLINKPAGWTSFDAVNYVRKGIRKTHPTMKNIKVGHAGTLDPFATGLLIIGVGRTATRELDSFKALKKTYRATIRLGAVSDTDDSTGVISPTSTTEPTREQVETILRGFVGEQAQTPPMYSAKKLVAIASTSSPAKASPSRASHRLSLSILSLLLNTRILV